MNGRHILLVLAFTVPVWRIHTITLRHDGFDYDIGYNRQVVRPDGKVVTVYYYRTFADGQSPTHIAATIWDAEL